MESITVLDSNHNVVRCLLGKSSTDCSLKAPCDSYTFHPFLIKTCSSQHSSAFPQKKFIHDKAIDIQISPSRQISSPEDTVHASSTPSLREGPAKPYGEKPTSLEKLGLEKSTCLTEYFNDSTELLSPIRFSTESRANVSTPAASTADRFLTANTAKHSKVLSNYIFYPPQNPSDKPRHILNYHHNIPRRQLSYGESLSNLKPRFLHKTATSPELRHHVPSKSASSTPEPLSGESLANRPYYSKPMRNQPRLRLDSVEDDGKIEEAVSLSFIAAFLESLQLYG